MTALIILPGMDGTGLLLEAFIAALGPGFDVKVVRYPDTESAGYGELEVIARTALPQAGPFFILGESFSGPLAVTLASAFPDRVQGLILCASFVRNPRPGLSWLKPFIDLLPLSRAPAAALGYLLLGKHGSAEMRAALAETLARIAPATLRARLRAALGADVSAGFAALGMPILYLRAAHDRTVPRRVRACPTAEPAHHGNPDRSAPLPAADRPWACRKSGCQFRRGCPECATRHGAALVSPLYGKAIRLAIRL